jgi:ATP-dependent RNA helicase DHX37/DHR1
MPKFVPRSRKHKVLERSKPTKHASSDSNQIEIVPATKSEKEEKRQRLKEELRAGQSKISSKKQKRLDKYIETKLKKDENVALLKKLGNAKVDTAGFQSSKHLGKRTFKDFVEDGPARIRPSSSARSTNVADVSDLDSEDSFEQENEEAFRPVNEDIATKLLAPSTSVGSGLKSPLGIGEDGLPVIETRQRNKKPKAEVDVAELPWEGFETEASDGVDDNEQDEEDISESGSSACEHESEDDTHPGFSEDSDDESEENDSETSEMSDTSPVKPRTSAFKSWATQQVNKSLGHVPSYEQDSTASEMLPSSFSHATPANSLEVKAIVRGTNLETAEQTSNSDRKAFSVQVDRPKDVQDARMSLPIVAEEQKIMEAIHNNSVVLVWGATGSGKTTQLPQFLFEAGYGNAENSTPGMIGVTQPRRVAAVSMASRVKFELGQHGDKVAYQVRFDSSVSKQTAIKYMTDGILLRELSQDVMLSKYSVIIIDEAHERSINTDVLIGMLSRVVPLRLKMSALDLSTKPLKLVIMSATLRTSDFLQNPRLFRPDPVPPPLVQAEGRQFPVTIHFARRTQRDYLEEVCNKVVKGHRKLPHGGILVFLTGQSEIKSVREKLLQALPSTRSSSEVVNNHVASSETPVETEDLDFGHTDINDDLDEVSLITGLEEDDESAWEEKGDAFDLGEMPSGALKVHILPLYSQLPTKEQLKVFGAPPDGSRLIILATNVAETSLTIPGIKYVFDAGRSKERVFDEVTGVQSFETNWISKASAEQRAGRAGRTQAGHCYRLYSSAVYERDFPQHAEPEILRTPIESVVLQLKSFHVENVLKFPFPTPPSRDSLARAELLLKNLGALTTDGRVTPLGTKLSTYPISPRLSKMLNICMSSHSDLMGQVVIIAAALSVGELFMPENLAKAPDEEPDFENEQIKKDQIKARAFFSKTDPKSDVTKLLTAVLRYEKAENKEEFCERMFIRSKAMQEVTKLRSQLLSVVRANNTSLVIPAKTALPAAKQCTDLNEMVASGYIDQIAIRADLAPSPPEMLRRPKRAIDVPYLPLMPLQSHPQTLTDRAIFLHPTSVLARLSPTELPAYVVYSHLQRSQPSSIETEQTVVMKTRMFLLAPMEAEQLARLAYETPLLEYGKPIGHKIAMLGGTPERRECWVVPSLTSGAGAIGWPLPARKVVQKKDRKVGWVIEKFLS